MYKYFAIGSTFTLMMISSTWGNVADGGKIQDLTSDQLINNLLSNTGSDREWKEALIEIFNRGEEAIPALLSSLESVMDNKDEFYARFNSLIYLIKEIGGSTQAIKSLKPYLGGDQFTSITKDSRINSMKLNLCADKASLADSDCEALLLKYFENSPIDEAVYTFGVSRNKKYLPILEKELEWFGGTHGDLQRAIYWIKVGPMPAPKELSDLQRIRQLIFEYMFIGSGAKKPYYAIKLVDPEKQEFIGYDNKIYYLKPGEDESALLKEKKVNGIVTFGKVIFNRDKTRAYTDLEYYWGGKSGRGYFFILEKIHNEWQLIFALPTWIA